MIRLTPKQPFKGLKRKPPFTKSKIHRNGGGTMKYYWHILDLTSGEIVEHPFPYKSYRKALYAAKRFINYRVDRSLKRVCSIHITTNINFRFPDSELGWSPR